MLKIKYYFDKFLEFFLALIMLVMSLVVLWQVFTRFVLDSPSSWSEELARFLMVWMGFLGGAVGLKYGTHLGLTLFLERIKNDNMKKAVEIIGHFLCIVMGAIIVYYGYVFMIEGKNQVAQSLGFKMLYVYTIVPFSGLVIILNSLELIYYSVKKNLQPGQEINISIN